MPSAKISALFLDVGGVLLTNGWDRRSRQLAASTFKLDYAEMDDRHKMTFDTYECGKTSLDDYLDRVVFYKPRDFTRDQFKTFMYEQSKPLPHMIDFAGEIYCRQEGQGILLGTYEQNNKPWSPEQTPWEFVFQLLDHDEKRLRAYQEIHHADGWLAATSETMSLHIDMAGPRVAPFPADIRARVEAMRAAHAALPMPERAGRSIGIKRRTVA